MFTTSFNIDRVCAFCMSITFCFSSLFVRRFIASCLGSKRKPTGAPHRYAKKIIPRIGIPLDLLCFSYKCAVVDIQPCISTRIPFTEAKRKITRLCLLHTYASFIVYSPCVATKQQRVRENPQTHL